MSKTNINMARKYIGYKAYKELLNGEFQIIRIIGFEDFNNKFVVTDLETNKSFTITQGSLSTDYTLLEPKGFLMFNIVKIASYEEGVEDGKDVIISAYNLVKVKMGEKTPYAICRQGVVDVFYNTISTGDTIVGLCVSAADCPPNFPYGEMLFADDIISNDMVSYYIDDTMEDILKCVPDDDYDIALEEMFNHYMLSINPLYDITKDDTTMEKGGWCRSLELLLKENSMITDIDVDRGVTAIDFPLEDYLVDPEDKDAEYKLLSQEVIDFFAVTWESRIKECNVIKYSYDINLGDFNNTNYLLVRDSKNITWIIVYLTYGKYLEGDLELQAKKESLGDKFRLAFYNKYMAENH